MDYFSFKKKGGLSPKRFFLLLLEVEGAMTHAPIPIHTDGRWA